MDDFERKVMEAAVASGFKRFGDRLVSADEGSSGEATRSVMNLALAIREIVGEECVKKVDEMVDWPLEQHPCATITDSPQYLAGIRRGLVNATNAIRALTKGE